MAFILAARPIAAYPIKARVYDQNGNPADVEFVAKYHRHLPAQVNDLQNGITNKILAARGSELIKRPDGSEVPEWTYGSDMEFIAEKLADWSDVQAPDGADVPFTDAALRQLVDDYPELVVPLFRGFFEAHSGVREKN